MKFISSRTRQIGIILALLLAPVVARLVWEMTYLTWREGEQMIGFTMMHVFPLFFLVGYAAYFGAAIWVVLVGGAFVVRKRQPITKDSFLLVTLLVLCALPIIPYPAWQRLAHSIWGPPPLTAQRLFRAVSEDDVDQFNNLLSRGMNLNTLDHEGCSLLFRAASWSRPEFVKLLLSKGVDVNRQSCRGETALFPAALDSDVPIIHLLLDAGADPQFRDPRGKTPADMVVLFAPSNDPERRRSRDEAFRLLNVGAK